MENTLKNLNQRLIIEKRKVLFFLNNVPSHDPGFVGKVSYIKVIFLPANTTLKLQPLDAGITKNYKVLYRGAVTPPMVPSQWVRLDQLWQILLT